MFFPVENSFPPEVLTVTEADQVDSEQQEMKGLKPISSQSLDETNEPIELPVYSKDVVAEYAALAGRAGVARNLVSFTLHKLAVL